MTRTLKTALLIAGRMTNVALFLGLGAALSRLLPRTSYGAFQQVMLVYLLSSNVLAIGLPQSIFYFLPRYEGVRRKTFMVQTLCLLAGQGALLTVGLYLGADALGNILNSPELPPLLRAFAPYTIFMLPFYAMDATMMTANRPLTAVGFAVLSRAVAFVAVVTPVALGGDVLLGIRLWVAAAALEGFAAATVMLRHVGGVSLHDWRPILKEQIRYALPIGGAVLLGGIQGYADKVIVSMMFGAQVYAGYANGAMEVPLVGILVGSVSMVMFPELVVLIKEQKTEELRSLWTRAIEKTNVVLLPFLGGLLFIAPELMMVLFGKQYSDSAAYFRVYLLMLPVRVVMYGPLAMSFGANAIFLRSQAIAMGVAVVGCATLAWTTSQPVFVPVGAVAGIYAGFLYAAWRLSGRMGIRMREFLPLKHWLAVLAVSLICGAVAWVATLPLRAEGFAGSLLRLGCASGIFAVCYLSVTQWLHLADWRGLVRSILSRRKPPIGDSPAA